MGFDDLQEFARRYQVPDHALQQLKATRAAACAARYALYRIVAKLMARDPAARYESAHEALGAL